MRNRKKILLIDDEEDFCFFVRKNLEQTREFEVTTATTGEEGIRLARKQKPDLILLDILMPKLTGNDVAEVLYNDPTTKDIPFVFLTAIVTNEEVGIASVKEIGGSNFIAKPVDTEKLVGSIKMVLGKRPKI
jgi:CheY-like chemotaxis protein